MSKTICFDIRCLQIGHESRGIGMHVKSLLEHLPKNNNGVKYVLYAFDKNDPVKTLEINMPVPYELITTPTVKKSIDSPRDFYHLAKIIWHRFTPLRNNPPDIFVQFDFMLGLPRFAQTQTVLFAYDLIPLLFRDEYMPTVRAAWGQARGLMSKMKKSLRAAYYQTRYALHYRNFTYADKIAAISKSTAESLQKELSIPLSKVQVVPLAPVFTTTQVSRPKLLGEFSDDFIFYIGATDSRKRVQDLIKAWETQKNEGREVKLVLAGKEFDPQKEIPNISIRKAISDSPYKEWIIQLGYVDDSEKLWLYTHAAAFVYPTLYEGFGIPVIEAMSNNCPVITYSNSSIPEVAGDAALLVQSGDVLGLSDALRTLLTTPLLVEELKKKGKKQSALFTWEHHVELLLSELIDGKDIK